MLVAAARLTFNAVVIFLERINLYFCVLIRFTSFSSCQKYIIRWELTIVELSSRHRWHIANGYNFKFRLNRSCFTVLRLEPHWEVKIKVKLPRLGKTRFFFTNRVFDVLFIFIRQVAGKSPNRASQLDEVIGKG